MKKLQLLRKHYNLFEINFFKQLSCIGGSIFVLFFLWIFQPFGFGFFSIRDKIILSMLYSLPPAIIWYFILYKFKYLSTIKHTIGSTLLILVIGNLTIGFYIFAIYELYFFEWTFTFGHYPKIAWQVFEIGLLVFAILALLHNSYNTKMKIKSINQIKQNLNEIKSRNIDETSITLKSYNNQSYFTINPNKILFITTEGNYAEINWVENEVFKKSLIRNTLSNIEKDISKQCNHIVRCHNSYLVNLLTIKNIVGNSSLFTIRMNLNKIEIPISRKYRDTFLLKIEQLKQLSNNTIRG